MSNFRILACFTRDFLTAKPRYSFSFWKALKLISLVGILLFFLAPDVHSQNTKGDRPEKRSAKRESKFRQGKKKVKPKKPYNRVQGRRLSLSNRASASRQPKVYPQKGPFVNNRSVTTKISRQNSRSSKGRIAPASATGRTRNTYPQRGMWVNNESKKQKAVSNNRQVSRLNSSSYRPPPPKRKRVVPKSASRSYVSRRSINAFAGFWNKKPRQEKAYKGDITGRKLRTKNFETKRPPVIKPTSTPYYGKKRAGDRPYKGPAAGSHRSATRTGKAWRGDIAGRKIRGKNFTSKKTIEGQVIFPRKLSKSRTGEKVYSGKIPGGGPKSITGKIKKGTGPLPAKAPGIGANRIGTYRGNIRGGKKFSPQGESYTGNIRGGKKFSPQGEDYTGNIKARRPYKGGGSVSRKGWNNKGYPVTVKTPSRAAAQIGNYRGNIRGRKAFSPQGEDYTGNIKARRPYKGGGSVSAKGWNNKGYPITVRTPSRAAAQMGSYRGNLRGGRKAFSPQGEDYTGNIKAHRPYKGGGSVSGKLWNNKQTPLPAKAPGAGADKIGGFPGKVKKFDLYPSMRDQGETFTGTKKAKKPVKGGGSVSGKLWNNKEQPIAGKTPGETAGKIDLFKGKHKRKDYVKNPNQAEEALKKVRPDKTTYMVDDLQVKVKEKETKNKPHAAKGALPGVPAGKNSIKASEYAKVIRQRWNYKHNPSASDDAMDTHEPSKAFARATDYQGNIKMKKFKFFDKKDLHPDATFVKTQKNNVDEEKGVLTNFKLWWARLFKKNDTQPEHLKQKIRKPRYDKGEQGLWYD